MLIVGHWGSFSIKAQWDSEFWGAGSRLHFSRKFGNKVSKFILFFWEPVIQYQVTHSLHHCSHSIDGEATWKSETSLREDLALVQVITCTAAPVMQNKSSLSDFTDIPVHINIFMLIYIYVHMQYICSHAIYLSSHSFEVKQLEIRPKAPV